MGFAELPSKHGPHRSFASENVFPKLSPCKRTVELYIERLHQKTRFHSSSLFSLLILILSTRALPLAALFQRSPAVAAMRVRWSAAAVRQGRGLRPPDAAGGFPSPRLEPRRPPLGFVSPQRPSPVATGSGSPETHEARPVVSSPSSSRCARSPGAPP
jgi:hypothetical protein